MDMACPFTQLFTYTNPDSGHTAAIPKETPGKWLGWVQFTNSTTNAQKLIGLHRLHKTLGWMNWPPAQLPTDKTWIIDTPRPKHACLTDGRLQGKFTTKFTFSRIKCIKHRKDQEYWEHQIETCRTGSNRRAFLVERDSLKRTINIHNRTTPQVRENEEIANGPKHTSALMRKRRDRTTSQSTNEETAKCRKWQK